MDHKEVLDREEVLEFVMSCWDDEAGPSLARFLYHSIRVHIAHFPGAFGAHPDHDAHILSTLSAIQILTIHDGLDRMDTERVVKCNVPDGRHNGSLLMCHLVISSLQQPSGVFAGDSFGEVDTRFSYCAINALSLLGRLSEIDVDNAVSYIRNCRNFDGGFGSCVGAESHAAQGLPFSCARRFTHPS